MRARQFFCFCALLTITCIVYAKGFTAGFVGDDLAVIPNNHQNFSGSAKIFDYFRTGVWNHTNLGLNDNSIYRPLWLTWVFLIYQLAGEAPLIWHMSNLLLHLLNAVLLFCLIRHMYPSAKEKALWAATMLFLVYPAGCQNVLWVSGSTDLLLTTFVFSALLCYLMYRSACHERTHLYVATLCLTVCAMLVKETGIVLLPLFLLIDFNRNVGCKTALKSYIPFSIMLIGYAAARLTALGYTAGPESPWIIDSGSLLRAVEYAATYLRTLFFPWPLPFTTHHPTSSIESFADPLLGVLLLAFLVWLFITRPATRLAIGIILLPLSIPVMLAFNLKGLFAARFLYLPAAGLVLLGIPLVAHLFRNKKLIATYGLYFVLMSALTIAESSFWKNQGILIGKIIPYEKTNANLWIEQAQFYADTGDTAKALSIFHLAESQTASNDDKAKVLAALAKHYAYNGEYDKSLQVFRKILDIPGQAHTGWAGIGNVTWMLGKPEESLDAYKKAITAKPNDFYTLYNYGMLNAQLKQFAPAIKAFETINRLPPSNIPANERGHIIQNLMTWRRIEQLKEAQPPN